MSDVQSCRVGAVAAVFRERQGEIVAEWRSQAETLLRDLNLEKPQLLDHMPDVIAEIVRDLELRREGDLSAEHIQGSPPVHGVQRVYDGLDVGEVVTEYNLLRVAFLTVAERHGVYVVGEAARIINHRIDEAVRLAVTAFAAQQALLRKEREDEHLAFVAHDLRTPLNAALLLVEELEYGLDEKALAETVEVFEVLRRNLRRLEELIKRVLELRAHAGVPATSFRPEQRTFELWPLTQRLISELRPVWSRERVSVVNDIPRGLTVFADAGLISQVLQNLLANAFKYTVGGRVVTGASAANGMVTCTVKDNGEGIPPEILPLVFEKHTSDPDKDGDGLGLAIVKQIVEAHGGTVTAESSRGQGTIFTFTLPEGKQDGAPVIL